MALSTPTRFLAVFFWFSATSFYHGVALITLSYFVLTRFVPYGLSIFLSLLLPYLAVVMTSKKAHNLKATWPWFIKSFVTQAPIEYFGMRVLGEEELDAVKDDRILVGLHPHGVYPLAGILFYSGASPLLLRHPWLRVRPAGASVLFKIPIIREYLLWTAHLDASKRTLSKHMEKRVDDIGLVVGGEKEALATRNGKELVVLAGRTGFVSLAAKYGYTIVPTYAFGQNETYTVSNTTLGGLQTWLQRNLKWSIPVFYGRGFTPMPHKVQVSLAVGTPIRVPAPASPGAEPPAELVEALHKQYVASLQAAFEKHKAAAGYADRALAVVDVKGRPA